MTSHPLTEKFAQYLKDDGKRPLTIESYTTDIAGFLTYLSKLGEHFTGQLKRFHITSYRNKLVEESYEPATINKKINSLQAFNHWLIAQKITEDHVVDPRKDKIKTAAGSEKQVEIYTEKEIEKLLYYIQSNVSARDRAIIVTLLYTGIRVSELCDIKIKNLDFLTNHLKIIGKGGKVREVPMKTEVTEAIKQHLKQRAKTRYAQSEYLFAGQKGSLQRDAINTMLEKLSTKANLGIRLKPHTFRHTFCTRLIQKGVPISIISKLAGHASIETTARFYINSSKEDKMKAINCL